MKKTKMLKKNYEFKEVLSKGKYYSGDCIEAFIIKDKGNTKKEYNFLGVAVSTKIAKAIMRNHIKRLIRESYKNVEKNLKTGNKIVFLWKKKISTENANYENVSRDMRKVFDKAELFKEI